jgi:hypothetical protein
MSYRKAVSSERFLWNSQPTPLFLFNRSHDSACKRYFEKNKISSVDICVIIFSFQEYLFVTNSRFEFPLETLYDRFLRLVMDKPSVCRVKVNTTTAISCNKTTVAIYVHASLFFKRRYYGLIERNGYKTTRKQSE